MIANRDYKTFLTMKCQAGPEGGFEPLWMPDKAFDFQQASQNLAAINKQEQQFTLV